MNLQEVGFQITRQKALKEAAEDELDRRQRALDYAKEQIESNEKARWIVTEVAKQTQEEFTNQIEGLVTSAIRAVFEERDFVFKLELERKRNKLECRMLVLENGEELDPKDDMGGGIVDIIAFALRVVLWHFENPRTRNMIYLDEPFRFTGALQVKAGAMMKELSKKLCIQFIFNTHDDALIDVANKGFGVEYAGGRSKVQTL